MRAVCWLANSDGVYGIMELTWVRYLVKCMQDVQSIVLFSNVHFLPRIRGYRLRFVASVQRNIDERQRVSHTKAQLHVLDLGALP
jgi:hypothetical protein